jgi:DNA repair protein RadC
MDATPTPIPIGSRRRSDADPRLARLGADAVDDFDLLAALLGTGATARRTARRLIDRFGGLAEVVQADPIELAVAGLPTATAARVGVVLEIGRRASRPATGGAWRVTTPSDVGEPLVDGMGSLEREELRVLLLDTKNVVTAERTVYRGNLAGSSVRVGEVYRDAVRRCAAAIVVVHNHPSGDPSPSGEDLRITAELAEAGRLLDIELLDHVIVGRGRWTSLRAIGALGQPPTMR